MILLKKNLILSILGLVVMTESFMIEAQCSKGQCAIKPVVAKSNKADATVTKPINRGSRRTGVSKKREKRNTMRTMPYEQLAAMKKQALEKNDFEVAIRCVERQLKLCDDIDEIAKLLIELGDLHFESGAKIKAEQIYAHFRTLYPGSQLVEYAHYKNILAAFHSTYSYDRDQTKTRAVIDLADEFLKQDLFVKYRDETENIRRQCFQKLFESEQGICQFHLDYKRPQAAKERIALARNELATQEPSLEPQLLLLESKIAQRCGDNTLYHLKKTELTERFPKEYENLTQAQTKRTFSVTELF